MCIHGRFVYYNDYENLVLVQVIMCINGGLGNSMMQQDAAKHNAA